MADQVHNHINTVKFCHHRKTFSVQKENLTKKKKRKTAMLLADKEALTGTAKLVLDINTQKNDAR